MQNAPEKRNCFSGAFRIHAQVHGYSTLSHLIPEPNNSNLLSPNRYSKYKSSFEYFLITQAKSFPLVWHREESKADDQLFLSIVSVLLKVIYPSYLDIYPTNILNINHLPILHHIFGTTFKYFYHIFSTTFE